MKKLLVLLLTVFALNSCEQDPEIIGVDVEKKLPKVDVCHYDEYTDTWKTISINENALKAHLKHGDYEGECKVYTYVPDDSFEQQLIDKGFDDVRDNYVMTSSIDNVLNLVLKGSYNSPSAGHLILKDITGLEDFQDLENFVLIENSEDDGLKILDLPDLKNLKSIKIGQDYVLEELHFPNKNSIENIVLLSVYRLKTLNTDSCKNLKFLTLSDVDIINIDVSNNLLLEDFIVGDCDVMADNLDLSNNVNLKRVSFRIVPYSIIDLSYNVQLEIAGFEFLPYLEKVNLQNGNNVNMTRVTFMSDLRNLDCVLVDDADYSNSSSDWYLEPPHVFSEICPIP